MKTVIGLGTAAVLTLGVLLRRRRLTRTRRRLERDAEFTKERVA